MNKFWVFLAVFVSFGLFSGCKTISFHSTDAYLDEYADNIIKYSETEDVYFKYKAEYNFNMYLKARANEINSNNTKKLVVLP